VAFHDPAHVAGAVDAQQVTRGRRCRRRQQPLDRPHGADQARLVARGECADHLADLCRRMPLERREGGAAARRQREVDLPAVGTRPLLDDHPALREAAQDAAEIAGVEAELAADLARGRLVAMGDFIKDARLRQRERARRKALLQHADALRIEAVEPPHRRDARGKPGFGHDTDRDEDADQVSGNYLTSSSICLTEATTHDLTLRDAAFGGSSGRDLSKRSSW
jgi:hypothetical protein